MIQMYEVNNLLASCSEQKRSFAQRSRNCFARVDFRCGVLKETLCKKGLCTFYRHRQDRRTAVGWLLRSKSAEKSKMKYDEDKKKYPHRDCIERIEKGGRNDG